MRFDGFFEILTHILSSTPAGALALSKGGWEGWLQCEIWNGVSEADTTIEREVRYPDLDQYCDLVCFLDDEEYWIELKAFGKFQADRTDAFLDSFAKDVFKLGLLPDRTRKLALLVVPKNIGDKLIEKIRRRWKGVNLVSIQTVNIVYIQF